MNGRRKSFDLWLFLPFRFDFFCYFFHDFFRRFFRKQRFKETFQTFSFLVFGHACSPFFGLLPWAAAPLHTVGTPYGGSFRVSSGCRTFQLSLLLEKPQRIASPCNPLPLISSSLRRICP
ncbi:MAG: hypothetical protein IKL23_07655 [Oscillospiraceae bacterium]|nr:hypothetical protein [Oscillospiraceae bacterium]